MKVVMQAVLFFYEVVVMVLLSVEVLVVMLGVQRKRSSQVATFLLQGKYNLNCWSKISLSPVG